MTFPLPLAKLLRLQWLFAALAFGFLIASGLTALIAGAPLSAAPVAASLVMFTLYATSLKLPGMGRVGWYRLAMIPAIVVFGGGGVIANVVQNGLDDYASVPVFVVAVGINLYGTILNIIVALGLYRTEDVA
ncbi:hypothetical protein R5H30_08715 [Sulfitobacter sp. D35]|uniref:hypothetical protein n=1 Tax=Sulfitobacter sp. D35 TaxID=3083252 RepID=UPI00296EFC7A|nr:hypothetical protein [Sulfitobacter sp. D35]MDW4498057.1 hypothetical protein [Sulfitobacter sp. D35]